MLGKGNKNVFVFGHFGLSMLTSALSVLILLKIVSELVLKETIGEGQVGIAIAFTLLISSFLGALVLRLLTKSVHYYVQLGLAVMYMSIILCCGMLLFDGQLNGVLRTAGMIAGGTVLSCLPGKKNKNRMRVKRTR